MSGHGPAAPPRVPSRVQRALYRRCRRGEPEALSALLYTLVDRLYTAASYVLPDETTAVTVVAEAWHDLLEALRGPMVGGHLARRAYARLEARLLLHAGAAAVRKAVHRAAGEEEDGLLSFPAADLRLLLDTVPASAAGIAEATTARRRQVRQASLFAAAFVSCVVGYNVWLRTDARASAARVKLACLQETVRRHDLVAALRETSEALTDPRGADRYEARVLQQVGLALEEVANLQAAHGRRVLDFIAERVREEALSDALTELMAQREGMARKELAQAQLVLEEVENL